MDKVRHVRMLGLCLVAAFAISAVAAASAVAVIKNPTESIKIFKNCPIKAKEAQGEPLSFLICVFAATEPGAEGGHYTVGSITVPLEKQISLQYGLGFTGPFEEHERFVPPINGVEAISPTPEKVPGEPIAHLSLEEQIELGWPETLRQKYREGQKKGAVKKVYEAIELAGIPATNRTNIIFEEGTGVEAPVKIKGENKWLSEIGDVCYIGSNAEPIVQHLTSGASTSPLTGTTIHGSAGELSIVKEGSELWLAHSDLVDNTYPVPGVTCTGPFSEQIDAAIDREFGIPAVAGASVTELKGTLYNAVTAVAEKAGA
jgi:hypothetical protein